MDSSTIMNVLIIALIAWFIYTRFAPTKGLKNLSTKAFENELMTNKNKVIIDVREPQEYKTGYIPNAMNIPLSQLKSRIGEIPKDKNIYLYCRSGMRSKQAARVLSKHGYSQMAQLQGGIMAWRGKIHK